MSFTPSPPPKSKSWKERPNEIHAKIGIEIKNERNGICLGGNQTLKVSKSANSFMNEPEKLIPLHGGYPSLTAAVAAGTGLGRRQ